jgi:hypothetical protein
MFQPVFYFDDQWQRKKLLLTNQESLKRHTEYAFCRKVTFLGELLGKAKILDILKR